MAGQLAARLDDQVGAHSGSSGSGFRILGSALKFAAIGAVAAGLVVAAVAAAPVLLAGATAGAAIGAAAGGLATFGGAAALIGGALSGASQGIHSQREQEQSAPVGGGCSKISVGSPNVFVEGKPAARAKADKNSHGSGTILKQGSATVYVNGKPFTRKGDCSCCGGKVITSASRTFIGGPPSEAPASGTDATSAGAGLDAVNWNAWESGLGIAGLVLGVGSIGSGAVNVVRGAGGLRAAFTTVKGLSQVGTFGAEVGGGFAAGEGLHRGGDALGGAVAGTQGAVTGALIGEGLANAFSVTRAARAVSGRFGRATPHATAPHASTTPHEAAPPHETAPHAEAPHGPAPRATAPHAAPTPHANGSPPRAAAQAPACPSCSKVDKNRRKFPGGEVRRFPEAANETQSPLALALRATQHANPMIESLRKTGSLPKGTASKPFENREGLVPNAPGRTWREADVPVRGAVNRKNETARLLYSNDGLVYVSHDHFQTAHPVGDPVPASRLETLDAKMKSDAAMTPGEIKEWRQLNAERLDAKETLTPNELRELRAVKGEQIAARDAANAATWSRMRRQGQLGDLRDGELRAIQERVDKLGEDVYVVGSAAKGKRRNLDTDLPLATDMIKDKAKTRSDIDYAAATEHSDAANDLDFPDADGKLGVLSVDAINLKNSPAIRFRKGEAPQYFPQGEGGIPLNEDGARWLQKKGIPAASPPPRAKAAPKPAPTGTDVEGAKGSGASGSTAGVAHAAETPEHATCPSCAKSAPPAAAEVAEAAAAKLSTVPPPVEASHATPAAAPQGVGTAHIAAKSRSFSEQSSADMAGGVLRSGKPLESLRRVRSRELTEADLGYDNALRAPRPVELPNTIDDLPKANVREVTNVTLASDEHSGSAGFVRVAELADGRPVALKTYYTQNGDGESFMLGEARSAKLFDDLGIGPKFHGTFVDADGRTNIVTDIVRGDFSGSQVTPQTFKDLETMMSRLDGAGVRQLGDFQYFVTPEGRAMAIDPGAAADAIGRDPFFAPNSANGDFTMQRYALLRQADPQTAMQYVGELKQSNPDAYRSLADLWARKNPTPTPGK